MIERDDLRAAVAAGILTEGQASRLAALSASRQGTRENLSPGDEPFELFKGFNEIFIVVGLAILATGWIGVTSVAATSAIRDLQAFGISRALLGAAVLWLLAEYFVRHRRMVAPAIALTFLWAGNAAFGFTAWKGHLFMLARNDLSSLPLPLLLTTVAIVLFWARFRVPIALAMVALGIFAAAMILATPPGTRLGSLRELFLLSADSRYAWITLAIGLATFAVAMAFDMSDPHRVTRRAANGFWLHVVAAPAIVNTVALSLLQSDRTAILVLFLALIGVVAIVVDRRSFLIAGIGYVVVLATTLSGPDGAAATILALGIAMLLTGAFWTRIRAVLLSILGPALPLDRLPPST